MRKRLSVLDSVLGATGCIYAIRRELAVPLPPSTLLDDVYLPLAAFFRGYRIVLDENARAYDLPASLKTEFRRKVRTQAGVYQLVRAYPALLGPSNRMWIHFVSHKLGRLMLPFALIVAAVSSFWLPPIILVSQLCFYGLAAIDPVVPEGWPVRRLTSPIRTFVVLMAAALLSVSIIVRPGLALWQDARSR
jgi:poly-beta-1,6-N-acetyl-D-glucosamine synthase